jgi:hypothetical protein
MVKIIAERFSSLQKDPRLCELGLAFAAAAQFRYIPNTQRAASKRLHHFHGLFVGTFTDSHSQ